MELLVEYFMNAVIIGAIIIYPLSFVLAVAIQRKQEKEENYEKRDW